MATWIAIAFALPVMITLIVLSVRAERSTAIDLADIARAAEPDTDELSAEVLFSSTSHGVASIDCITSSGPAAGWPIHLAVCLPMGGPWSAAAERTLERWADECAQVTIRAQEGEHSPRVRISDGSTAVLFDVAGEIPA